nr:hypothetical protein [Angustibacter aerolatus]
MRRGARARRRAGPGHGRHRRPRGAARRRRCDRRGDRLRVRRGRVVAAAGALAHGAARDGAPRPPGRRHRPRPDGRRRAHRPPPRPGPAWC